MSSSIPFHIMGQKTVQVHIPYPLLIERLDYVISEGINPEVYLDGEFLEKADTAVLKDIRERFREKGLTITMHGPYEGVNPRSADEEKREFTVKRYMEALRAASYLKPKTLVLHAGYSHREYKGDKDLWFEQSMKTWPPFVRMAERLGVVIAVENVFERTPDTLKRLVEEIGSPNLRLCIDAGHLNSFARADMTEWIREVGHLIAEVHLHDNSGSHDEHLPLGEGSIDFPLFFKLLSQYAKDPVYTIEPHGEEEVRRGIEAVKRYI